MKKYLALAILLVPSMLFAAVLSQSYTVKSGDTWESIAAANNITVQQLADLNQPSRGTRINIPKAPVVTPPPPPTPTPTPTSTPAGETRVQAYTTGYTYWDNTPPGSADISNPILHNKAGGVGTFADPITIAVGHSIIGGKDILDYPAGTKIYIPNVQKYFIVEDTCGDGNTPQNGACHKGYPSSTTTWLDMWIGGQSGTRSTTNTCAEKLTDANGEAHLAIINPAPNYKAVAGEIFATGCNQYGNAVVTQ